MFRFREVGERGEEEADCLEERTGVVLAARNEKAMWDIGGADMLEVGALDALEIRIEVTAGIFEELSALGNLL